MLCLPRDSIHHDTSSAFSNNVPFFGNARLVYWHLTLTTFVLQLRNIDTMFGKAEGVFLVNIVPREFQGKTRGATGPKGFWRWNLPRGNFHPNLH